jgi:hypothetical protein
MIRLWLEEFLKLRQLEIVIAPKNDVPGVMFEYFANCVFEDNSSIARIVINGKEMKSARVAVVDKLTR